MAVLAHSSVVPNYARKHHALPSARSLSQQFATEPLRGLVRQAAALVQLLGSAPRDAIELAKSTRVALAPRAVLRFPKSLLSQRLASGPS